MDDWAHLKRREHFWCKQKTFSRKDSNHDPWTHTFKRTIREDRISELCIGTKCSTKIYLAHVSLVHLFFKDADPDALRVLEASLEKCYLGWDEMNIGFSLKKVQVMTLTWLDFMTCGT